MANAALRPSLSAVVNQSMLGINPRMFVSPPPAGRRITAGFSFIHRISKSSSVDVWFPAALQRELDAIVAEGGAPGPENFPAQWAAVRQFELLHEAGNYKIYDMDVTHLNRTILDMSRNMRAGGYRVTVATLGSYEVGGQHDELEILDRRLQDRIARLIHMLYLDEQSEAINLAADKVLAEGKWDFCSALPHIGATLGARDLFRPIHAKVLKRTQTFIVPTDGQALHLPDWLKDHGVCDERTGLAFACVKAAPQPHQYAVRQGRYFFAADDAGREMTITYTAVANQSDTRVPTESERKHRLARHFFDVLGLLPQKHIVHDTAVGLQLPESINEHEWIYVAPSDESMGMFNSFLRDIFSPFDKISLSGLQGRADARAEVKASTQHMRSYGDRLSAGSDAFYGSLARLAMG